MVEATLSSRLCLVGFDVGLGVRPVSGSPGVKTPRVWRRSGQGSADTEQTLKRRAGSRHISGMAAMGWVDALQEEGRGMRERAVAGTFSLMTITR
jgi:hypothetical protein